MSKSVLYTVGHKDTYDPFLGRDDFMKVGKRDDYGGGVVFLTFEEAQDFLDDRNGDDYRVYGLVTDIENTYEKDGRRYLIEDAKIVEVDDENFS